MRYRPNRTSSLLAGLFTVLPFASFSQTVINGSFELGMDPNASDGLNIGMAAPDSSTILGWSLTSGTIDYIGARWEAADGARSVDLSGVSSGTLSQSIDGFTIGLAYEVRFMLAANPEGGSPIKAVSVSVGNDSGVFSFERPQLDGSMGWSEQRFGFTATAPILTLSFTSLNTDASGPALDGVRIQVVPELETCAMAAIAFAAAGIQTLFRGKSRHF